MRLEKRSCARTPDASQILVKGMDMFGAAFQERTNLLNSSKEGFALRLLRPTTRGGKFEISFSQDFPESRFRIGVEVAWVNQGLDGYQTIGVRAESLSPQEEQFKGDAVQPPPRDEN